MKIDHSNKRFAWITAGILVFIVLIIFMVFACGVGISNILKHDGFNPVNRGTPSTNMLDNSDPKGLSILRIKPGNDDVPVDQRIDDDTLYEVKKGKIELVADNIESPLPICVGPEWGADKWVQIRVKGGYEPLEKKWFPNYGEYFGYITITDKQGNTIYNPSTNMFVGFFLVEESHYTDWVKCDTWTYYNFTFDTICDNWIVLESTIKPDGSIQSCKQVKIHYDTHWKACEFDYILAHENHVPKSPTPDLK
ncbi:MAG: hypothetical protein ACFE91_16590 [Promethearchaeota archaeon]